MRWLKKLWRAVSDAYTAWSIVTIVSGLLGAGGTGYLAVLESLPYSVSVVMGAVVFTSIVWGMIGVRRLRAQASNGGIAPEFVALASYLPKATNVAPEPAVTKPTRHYSSSDKDRISEAFHELKEILNKETGIIQSKAQEVWQGWGQRQCPPFAGKPLNIPATIEQVREVVTLSGNLIEHLYDGLLNDYQGYIDLLDEALANEGSKPIYDLREAAQRLIHQLNTMDVVYQDVLHRSDEMANIVKIAIDVFSTTNVKVMHWSRDSLQRIEVQEKAILSEDR